MGSKKTLEVYYFYCLRYMLDTYKTLKYKKLITKINLTKYISPITNKIKNGEINNNSMKLLQ